MLKECIYGLAGISARIPAADFLIYLLKELDLINYKSQRKKRLIELTNLGIEFSRLSYQERDWLAKWQGLYLITKVISNRSILNRIYAALKLFNYDNIEFWRINCQDRRLGIEEERVIRLLQQLKVAFHDEGEIKIADKVFDLLMETIGGRCTISEEDLLELLKRNREYGIIAEEFVKFSEQNRLKKLGRDDLARLVKRVSQDNVAAGYDVASFDDVQSSQKYDRFIEVKGNVGDKITFYITRNEFKIANLMDRKYWIYCVLKVESEKERKIIKLRNPFRCDSSVNRLKVEPVVWRCEFLEMRK